MTHLVNRLTMALRSPQCTVAAALRGLSFFQQIDHNLLRKYTPIGYQRARFRHRARTQALRRALNPSRSAPMGLKICKTVQIRHSLMLAGMARATCQAKQIPIWSRNDQISFLGRTLFMPHGSSHYSLCSGALLEFVGGT